MDENDSYDVRGRQSRIFRLFCFDKEGLAHMTFYRIAIVIALLMLISMVIGLTYSSYHTPFINGTRVLFLLLWILFTPQLFETGKAAAVIASRGIVFGRLNQSFMKYGIQKRRSYIALKAIPYVVMLVWAVGFVGLLRLWFI